MDGELEISETRPWSDLPQEILGLFLQRLHYVDQIRFRAVCKGWRVDDDLVKCSDYLPWAISLDNYPSSFELFDPHSRKSYKVTDPTKFQDCNVDSSEPTTLYASKQGWFLLGQNNSSMFLLHPFANEAIFLPPLYHNFQGASYFNFMAATFTGDPKSPDCEIIVLSNSSRSWSQLTDDLYMNIYRLSTDTQWRTQYLKTVTRGAVYNVNIHYMNGKVYCLLSIRRLLCYNLADTHWEILTVELPNSVWLLANSIWEFLLTDKDGSLLLVLVFAGCGFEILSFDRFRKCWTNTDTGDSIFFVHEKTSFSAPSVANGSGCSLFYLRHNKPEDSLSNFYDHTWLNYYSYCSKNMLIEPCWAGELFPQMAKWAQYPHKICFIEPPYFRKSSSC